ncbi:MAG TPA: hypothetical protein VF546_03395, partial [Pyrinomonadaceae bacterium]
MVSRKRRAKALRLLLSAALVLPSLAFVPVNAQKVNQRVSKPTDRFINAPGASGQVYQPENRAIEVAAPVNVARVAAQEALEPSFFGAPAEIKAIHAPKGDKPEHGG